MRVHDYWIVARFLRGFARFTPGKLDLFLIHSCPVLESWGQIAFLFQIQRALGVHLRLEFVNLLVFDHPFEVLDHFLVNVLFLRLAPHRIYLRGTLRDILLGFFTPQNVLRLRVVQ